jgi:hypothetical protein
MKICFLKTFFSIILVINISYAIDYGHHITIKATDGFGQVDSVIFELREGATVGIDSTLGEQNIFMKPYNSNGLDLRIIQRNTITCSEKNNDTTYNYWLCGNLGILSFDNNYDFKREMRDIKNPFFFDHAFDLVIQLYAENFPVVITIEETIFELDVPIEFYDSNNYIIDSLSTDLSSLIKYHPDDIQVPLCVIHNESENHLIGFIPDMYFWDKIDERNKYYPEAFSELVYPNPVSDILTINLSESIYPKKISIYSIIGQKQFESDLREPIDVSMLPEGVYYLVYMNKAYKFTKISR